MKINFSVVRFTALRPCVALLVLLLPTVSFAADQWQDLTVEQREVLQDMEERWEDLDATQRERLVRDVVA